MSLKRPLPLLSLPTTLRTTTHLQCRPLHRLNPPIPQIPKPTPFVPDVPTFLTLIGRNLHQHAAKIPTWEALFSLSGHQLKESGVEPARARRYLLWWRERFRNGTIGVGGDVEHVKDGKAELRIVEVPSERPGDQMATLTKDPGMRKVVINTAPMLPSQQALAEGKDGEEDTSATATAPPARVDASEARPVANVKIHHGTSIGGKGVQLVKGHQGLALLKVQEGLWEQRRGHKVDGGERRRAMVRAKRRVQERKMAR